jgi:hypothetical protein
MRFSPGVAAAPVDISQNRGAKYVTHASSWGVEMRAKLWNGLLLGCVLGLAGFARAADLPQSPAPSLAGDPGFTYDSSRFELRGGGLASTWGPEKGSVDINGELVFPKVYSLPGWQDILIPRFHVGGMGNIDGRTSYGYAGGLWTWNYDRFFTEFFLGAAVHNGPLRAANRNQPNLGCRELYHIGANVGYRFDQHWSAMITFDHASDGEPTLSHCGANTGISVLGLRLGYAF